MHTPISTFLVLIAMAACQAEKTDSADVAGSRDSTSHAAGAESPPPPSGASPQLRLVDSIPYSNGHEGFLQHLELRRGSRVDTIRQILTDRPAVVAGDTLIYGFLYDTLGTMTHVFRYRVGTETLDSLPLPPDLQPGVSNPAFATDARHVAYVVFDSSARGVIRRYPDLAIVLETPRIQHSGGDVLGGSAGWHDARRFEIFIAPSDTLIRWIRFRGELGAEGLKVDTLRADAQPE